MQNEFCTSGETNIEMKNKWKKVEEKDGAEVQNRFLLPDHR
jgi:hypothetical protein